MRVCISTKGSARKFIDRAYPRAEDGSRKTVIARMRNVHCTLRHRTGARDREEGHEEDDLHDHYRVSMSRRRFSPINERSSDNNDI